MGGADSPMHCSDISSSPNQVAGMRMLNKSALRTSRFTGQLHLAKTHEGLSCVCALQSLLSVKKVQLLNLARNDPCKELV
ncbi:hypothetical protein CA54_60880 [Symmachiella macrocystis]|uniref:Uncharacterized protein n=1 Tax=Symmachiella macrocystis TaxID=2527985 RepID=A0A5C6AYY7_9PLAN|nr:hypothetical protein CA54_60880 [Symmachiella macrocystis]